VNLRNEWSTIEKNESLSWLLAFAVFYVVFCMFAVIITVIAYFNHLNPLTPHIYNYSTLLLLVYIMSFYGLRQQVPSKRILSDEELQTPYKNSTLTDDTKQLIQQKILFYFETGNGYLNPDLNMNVLSEHLKIPKYQITEVLNTIIGMNFFQFVNLYRVEAVKKMLADTSNKFSIEAIGYECGFSSKSAFYTVFKNMTGKTPVSYRNTIRL
jgi:AraC-like DNA-binding protein